MNVISQAFRMMCVAAVLFVLAGCSEDKDAAQAAHGMPPAPVQAVVMERMDVPIDYEYVGQTEGARSVEVRARVQGLLLKRTYREGSYVREGDVLFLLDPEKYRATSAQAGGELASLRAKLEQARLEYKRVADLYARGVVSAKERDDALAAYDSGKAEVAAAEAKLQADQLNLGYTQVRAPISGITSQETRSEGSLITTDSAGSLLTTITQLDPLYVNFAIPGTESMLLRRMVNEGRVVIPANGYNVRLKLADGSVYEETGKMTFEDRYVDPQTGSIRARAEIVNPDALVLPGEFVRVRLEGAYYKDALVIPERAVLFSQKGPMVYVLDDKNVATIRPVKLGQTLEKGIVVEGGLEAGERIVVDGIMKVRPGGAVMVLGADGKPVAQNAAPAAVAESGNAAHAEEGRAN
ncbi:efflux RND transporter periplasmic adaptor subunit [Desulfovibrio mangrovi]|uniref:efflux RND transporter periplasmic adaptor subunit n=1 Tax=Desulfovibrio mangrovi TaxID=2976983 RepID=UPI0022484437|nr:efflux RND transporter periplasmic adaptor subunit [Desulfovibrio mangrovi]UZP68943.1 efflux RND transporter periplasmic adaptor subunit [Desulfovibrio mangrovi]